MKTVSNIVWPDTRVTKESRSAHKAQRPCVLWFTGFSGSGKSTVANALEQRLAELKQHTYLLDGDNVRHGLNKDLGFSDDDRVENIRRIGEVAKLFVDAGLIVVTAFISPFRSERQMVRDLVEDNEFIEIHMSTPLGTCEQRDPKGLYKKARAGEIKHFTGIDSAYEAPVEPELELDSSVLGVDECVDSIIQIMIERNML
jgi:adenylylsulfate kinase